jgi:glycosyltransferase involved in cell wall biosynthesis
MRILYVHQFFATRRRAHPTRSYEFARRFVEKGHQVTLITRDTRHLEAGRELTGGGWRTWARETVDGIDVIYFNVPYSNFMGRFARLASFAAFTAGACVIGLVLPRPDVVLGEAQPLTVGLPGWLNRRLRGVPFVFEICDLWPYVPVEIGALRNSFAIMAATRLEETLYDAAETVVVCSEASRDNLAGRGYAPDSVALIPNASDCDLFGPDNVDAGWRARNGLEGAFVALYFGAVGPANGLDQLVEAAALLKEAADGGPDAGAGADGSADGGAEAGAAGGADRPAAEAADVRIVVVGDGRQKPRLVRESAERGIDNLLWLDPLPKDELAGVVGAADVTLTIFMNNPAFETNSPDKFFDSLAAGKPVVCNLGGWWKRLIEDEKCGAYVPGGDAAALAATLAALSREPEMVAEMGRNARALAERKFDRDLLADRLLTILENAVASGAGATS